ncbi:GRAM domain-containing protein [Natrarchaeobius chitinivorans]|nr:GRAM domain-containing protein [Natrarchaeobius chitinivorans]
MGDIGGWWVASHDANPGEETIATYHVNYLRPDRRPLGGKLYLTDQRLLFSPHLIDSLLGGETVAIDVRDIDDAARASGGENGGPPTDSLRLELASGESESFVVDELEDAIGQIRSALPSSGASRSDSPRRS